MRQTIRDYGYKLSKVPLLCDNESAIRMAGNPVEHSRSKHIDIRYHFLRDHQQKGDIEIAYVSTHNQLADIFTKPLDEKTFSKLRNELNILDSQNFDWNIAHIAHLYTFDYVSFIWYKCIFLILLVPRLRLMCLQVYFYD
jgi:FPC/CPF motif-containing protein YcgG